MKGPSSLSWQAVAVFLIAVAGGITLYLFVPPDDPARGALLTAFNGAIGAATIFFLGRRQDQIDRKVDLVVEQTNGHDASDDADASGGGGPSVRPPAGRHGVAP